MRKSFNRLNAGFKEKFGKTLTFRGKFDTEFFKRYSTTPSMHSNLLDGSWVVYQDKSYYLKPGERALPAPDTFFNGVEITCNLSRSELKWIESYGKDYGWNNLAGNRIKNPKLIRYMPHTDMFREEEK